MSTSNQASPAIYVFLVLILPNFLPCSALFVCNIYPKLLLTVSCPKLSLGSYLSPLLKHAHTITCCSLLINLLHIYLYIPPIFTFLFSFLLMFPHMRYNHVAHTSSFSTTSAEHNLYTAVCMNILTEAELTLLIYKNLFT